MTFGIDIKMQSQVFLVTESPLKMMKNAYFNSKALFVLKIFNFFSRLFWSRSKMALLKGQD